MSIISMLMQRKRTCIRQMSYSVDNMWIISDCWKSVFSDSFSAICLHLESGLDRITRYSTIIPKHKHVSNNCNRRTTSFGVSPCSLARLIQYGLWLRQKMANRKTHASVLRSIRGDKSSRKNCVESTQLVDNSSSQHYTQLMRVFFALCCAKLFIITFPSGENKIVERK